MNDLVILVLIAAFGFVSKFFLKDVKRSRREESPKMRRPQIIVKGNERELDEQRNRQMAETRENPYFERNEKEEPVYTKKTEDLFKSKKTGVNRSEKGPFQHLTKEQLREGIILAEVLSERPRAQNPHPAVSKYYRAKG